MTAIGGRGGFLLGCGAAYDGAHLGGRLEQLGCFIAHDLQISVQRSEFVRSEERRVGTGCVSTCRSRGSPCHSKERKQRETYMNDADDTVPVENRQVLNKQIKKS